MIVACNMIGSPGDWRIIRSNNKRLQWISITINICVQNGFDLLRLCSHYHRFCEIYRWLKSSQRTGSAGSCRDFRKCYAQLINQLIFKHEHGGWHDSGGWLPFPTLASYTVNAQLLRRRRLGLGGQMTKSDRRWALLEKTYQVSIYSCKLVGAFDEEHVKLFRQLLN